VTAPAPVSTPSAEAARSAATGHASGPAPYRALLVGSDLLADAAGEGTSRATVADALAGSLARRTGHGFDVEATSGTTAVGIADLLASARDLSRLDALVVVLAPRRDGIAPADLRERVGRTLSDLTVRLTVASPIVAVVPSPLVSGLSRPELDGYTRIVQEAAGALTVVVRLEDGPARTAADRIAGWAEDVAERTAGALVEPMVHFLPEDPFDELDRVDAVEAVAGRYGSWSSAFQEIVEAARSAYGTSAAAMSLIDDERTHYFARSGGVAESLPRGKTVCNRVMRRYGGLIVGDAAQDPRLAALPEVRTRDVVFYAGYRIVDESGAPLGALCVFDPEPRAVDEADLAPLRDLVIRAQRLLRTQDARRSA
jgi:hypothetical protein